MTKATKTATATATATTAPANVLDWYRDSLNAWHAKTMGPKPTAAQFEAAHGLGARPGTDAAMAVAMYLRDGGATQAQVVVVTNGPRLNKLRAIVAAGHATREPMPKNELGHMVYKLALPKAKAPAKAKAPRKPRTRLAKGAPVKAAPAKADTAPADNANA